jgi:hypothetical protein
MDDPWEITLIVPKGVSDSYTNEKYFCPLPFGLPNSLSSA